MLMVACLLAGLTALCCSSHSLICNCYPDASLLHHDLNPAWDINQRSIVHPYGWENTVSYLIFIEYHGHPWIRSPSTVVVVWECYFQASSNIWGHNDMYPSLGCCINHFKGSAHADIHRFLSPSHFLSTPPFSTGLFPISLSTGCLASQGERHNCTAV